MQGEKPRKENTMKELKNLNFSDRYMIAKGTMIYGTFESWDELVEYYNSIEDELSKHFCKIYDHVEKKFISGCLFWDLINAPHLLKADPWNNWN